MNDTVNEATQNSRVIPIFVDDVKLELPEEVQTGAQLRAFASVGGGFDLWQEVPGKKDDVLIRSEDLLDVKPGTHFYTAPSTINPGSC